MKGRDARECDLTLEKEAVASVLFRAGLSAAGRDQRQDDERAADVDIRAAARRDRDGSVVTRIMDPRRLAKPHRTTP
jgi:hypothetical protein